MHLCKSSASYSTPEAVAVQAVILSIICSQDFRETFISREKKLFFIGPTVHVKVSLRLCKTEWLWNCWLWSFFTTEVQHRPLNDKSAIPHYTLSCYHLMIIVQPTRKCCATHELLRPHELLRKLNHR